MGILPASFPASRWKCYGVVRKMVCPAFPKTQDAWPRGALPQGISGPHTLVSSETLETAGKMPTLPMRTAASPLLSSPNRTYKPSTM